ncbi:hypothetical protein FIBSPDRAFT_828265 [Athelia psychrophila]|uniref:BTB domain-containing protein n=1 Tax=Athelia psychrophila TaxID=1759441 RepID=A0A166HYH3_9AGAM|nr:hypothetical protein FIBSPDRAFT_828265 [Fibularhizoctonia sp. CBS 109695]
MDHAISLADGCVVCRKRVAQDVKEFNEMLLAELEVIICATAQKLVAKNNLDNPKQLSLSAGKPHTSKPVEVLQMFNDSNADLIIRTADDVSFRVHRVILSLSVPVFAAMFTLPQAPVDPDDSTPVDTASSVSPSIVDVSEGSATMQQFLQFCYPAADPDIGSLQGIQAILEVATKYDSDEIKRRAAKRLDTFLASSTLRVYAIAYRYKLEREVRLAAKRFLQNRISVTYVAELDFIPASAYHQLQEYHMRCQSVASQKFQTSGFSWIPISSSQGTITRFIWFTCRKCAGSPEVKIAANQEVAPTKWWSDYMESVSEILSGVPYHSAKALTAAKDRALEAAVQCSACQVKVRTCTITWGVIQLTIPPPL